MERQEGAVHLLADYWGIRKKTLYILLAIVACVAVAVTGIYIGIFGFHNWRDNMKRAGSMMVIKFDPQTDPSAAFQYICPRCGAVGLPIQGADGTPRCPKCNRPMTAR